MLKNPKAYVTVAGKFLKATMQASRGAWKIANLPKPIVSIFGGARLKDGSKYIYLAHELANKLVENNISVISGGGPGIMHAANCGAFHEASSHKHTESCGGCIKRPGQLRTMGLEITGIKGEKANPCVGTVLTFDYFFARKYLLIHFSCGYVIFPGGFGTMDELSNLLNLMQTGKLTYSPVILFGSEFWKDYLSWVKLATKEKLISPKASASITVTDDIDKAVNILKDHCKRTNN